MMALNQSNQRLQKSRNLLLPTILVLPLPTIPVLLLPTVPVLLLPTNGIFKMQDSEDLEVVFIIIVALNLKLQSLGPVG